MKTFSPTTTSAGSTLEIRVYEEVVVHDIVNPGGIFLIPPRLFSEVKEYILESTKPLQKLWKWFSWYTRPPPREKMNNGPFLAFDEAWFTKHQKNLVFLLNLPVIKYWFRYCMRIRSYDCPRNKRIDAIGPNRFSFDREYFKKGNEWYRREKTDFRTHNKFSKRMYYAFWPLWVSMHFLDWLFLDRFTPQLSFGFATITAYPDANPESATCDGQLNRGATTSWSGLRDGAGTAVDDTATTSVLGYLRSTGTSDQYNLMIRGVYKFDLSSVDDAASKDSGTLSFYVTAVNNGASFGLSVSVVSVTTASQTGLATADYAIANFGSTKYVTDVAFTGYTASQYNDHTLNASGLTFLSLTGITSFGTLTDKEVANSAPTWTASTTSSVVVSTADETGTSQDPKLVLNYTVVVDLDVSVNDTVTVSENINTDLMLDISLNDAITITENINTDLMLDISLNDEITISESIGIDFPLDVITNDSITVSESVSVENPDLGGVNVNDEITVAENITSEATLADISVTESIAVSESTSTDLLIDISLNESIIITESIAADLSMNISVNDAITITESVSSPVIHDPTRGKVHMRSKEQSYPIAMDNSEIF